MIFTQHYLGCLSHASYLVGDETTGRAVVVDPRRDVGVYLDEAADRGPDHRAGHRDPRPRRLPQRPPRARRADRRRHLLRGGRRGRVPDRAAARRAAAVAGRGHPRDPGHPGPHAGVDLHRRLRARRRRRALRGAHRRHAVRRRRRPSRPARRRRRRICRPTCWRGASTTRCTTSCCGCPDATRVFPAHGAGSSCGKQLSSETSSTLGEQRQDELRAPADGRGRVRRRGHRGSARRGRTTSSSTRSATARSAPLLDDDAPPLLDIDEVLARQAAGAVLLDAREPADFAAGHLRGCGQRRAPGPVRRVGRRRAVARSRRRARRRSGGRRSKPRFGSAASATTGSSGSSTIPPASSPPGPS